MVVQIKTIDNKQNLLKAIYCSVVSKSDNLFLNKRLMMHMFRNLLFFQKISFSILCE